MAFNRFTSIGSASARVTVDLSQVQESVAHMRSLSQQITQSVQQIQQSQRGIGSSTGVSGSASRTQESQQRLRVEQQITDEARKQFQIAQSTIGQLRTAVAEQANLFRTASAGAPSSVQRGPTEQVLRASRQPIVELQRDLARLRTAYLQATSPQARNALVPELQRIAIEARNATNSIQPLRAAVAAFDQEAQRASSGISGVFNRMQQGLARITEVGIGAQLQEISFRLLPLTAAMGLLVQRGVQSAQSIEEATISFRAFTGSTEEARNLMEGLRQQASRFGQPFLETVGVMQRFAPMIRQAGLELNDVFNLAVRLSTLNPTQGIEGALFAINEALAGQWRSLQTRFNIPTTQLREMIDQKGFVGGLDQFLNQLGRTTQFAEEFGQTSRAAFTRLQDSVDRFLAGSMNQFLSGMSQAANSASDLFNSLAEGPQIVQQLVGGFLTLGTSAGTALISVGQLALAISSIRTVVGSMNLSGLFSIVPAFQSAMPTVISMLTNGVTVAVRAGILAAVVGLGAYLGTQIAAALNIGGTSDPEEQANRLKQILFTAISAISEPFFVGAAVIGEAISRIVSAIDLIGTVIAGTVQDIVLNIEQAIQNIQIGDQRPFAGFGRNVEQARQETMSRFIVTEDGQRYVISVPGFQAGTEQTEEALRNFRDVLTNGTVEFIEGYSERAQRLLSRVRGENVNLEQLVISAADQARSFLQNIFSQMFPSSSGTPVPADGGLTLGGGGMGITPEQLEEIRNLWSQIQQQQREFALQEQRIMQDRMIAAQREAEDFALSQSRALENFNLQQIRAVEDYNRSRAQSIEDFERQLAESEAQMREQRQKQQEDFNKQMLRAQEDHLRDMVRMARDVDRAISARNFLEAQDQLERMRDAEEDFSIEQQRRREDFAQQIADLEENLQKQQDKRREDFERQLARQEENFNLQRQRQLADFERQRQLEEQDRQRRLQRQAQDYALQDQRRQEDFNRRIQEMIAHNDAMQTVWSNGLSNLRTLAQNFFNGIGSIIPGTGGGSGGTGGGSGGTGGTGGSGGVGGFPVPPTNPRIGDTYTDLGGQMWVWNGSNWQPAYGSPGGTVPGGIGGSGTIGGGGFTPIRFAVGTWNVPRTTPAIVDQGEIITPEPFASAVRRGDAVIGGRGAVGDTYQITVPLEVVNAQGMDEDMLAERVASKIAKRLENKRRENQPLRGRN